MIRRLLTRYRRGNPIQSIWLGALLASPVWVNTLVYRATSSADTVLLLGGSLVGGYVVARVFLGSVSADLEEVRAQNLWLQERAQLADEAFAAHPISVTVSDEEFAGIVEFELAALPAWIGQAIAQRNVAITVEEERAGEPRVFGVYQSQSPRQRRDVRDHALPAADHAGVGRPRRACTARSTTRCCTSSATCSG